MSVPGHALAYRNLAEIEMLRIDIINFKSRYQLAMSSLVSGLRELTELLESKGLITSDERYGMSSLNIFMDGGFENVM